MAIKALYDRAQTMSQAAVSAGNEFQAAQDALDAAWEAEAAAAKENSVRCISKATFKKKTFSDKTRCPTGWVKI